MLSQTLSDGLESYRIGPKIRNLRVAKSMGLAQLGEHTGLSASMLSKMERGQIFPTLPSLLRVAMVFGVGLDHFFSEGEDRPVLEIMRKRERIRLPDNPDVSKPAYYFESLDFAVSDRLLNAYLADFRPGAPDSAPHSHDGMELIYVISGQLELGIHGTTHVLDAGDSIFFDAGFDHSYRCGGKESCTAVVTLRNEVPD